MSPLVFTLILSCVSGALQALGVFCRPLRRAAGVLTLLWLAAALPILFFRDIPGQRVLLFYLLSAVFGLICQFGGKPHDV